MPRTALIGHTGFVGSNLLAAHDFDAVFNTKNIHELAGQSFDLLVSAGNRADSHRINTNGAEDLAEVDALIDLILSADIGKLVLVSTVCVYPGDSSPDENTPRNAARLTPYGANRLHQEMRLSQSIDTLVLRLPQLYGRNLKKGIVYDLAHDYRVEHIDPSGRFQYYDVRKLWADASRALAAGWESLNLSSPALTNSEVASSVFARDISHQEPSEASPFAHMYTRDMRSIHASTLGGDDGYIDDKEAALIAMRRFVEEEFGMREV